MKEIYLLELDDDDNPEDDSDHVEISLHALTVIRTDRTMRLSVAINGREVLALVDSGSTHTFLAEAVAQRLGFSPVPRLGMGVTVANDD